MVAATVGATPGPNNKQKTVNVVGDVGVAAGKDTAGLWWTVFGAVLLATFATRLHQVSLNQF